MDFERGNTPEKAVAVELDKRVRERPKGAKAGPRDSLAGLDFLSANLILRGGEEMLRHCANCKELMQIMV